MLVFDVFGVIEEKVIILSVQVIFEDGRDQSHFFHLVVALKVGDSALFLLHQIVLNSFERFYRAVATGTPNRAILPVSKWRRQFQSKTR